MNSISSSFADALATYNEYAKPQEQFAANLVQLLAKHIDQANISTLNRVLEIGCGTGFLTQVIMKRFAVNAYIANDIVAGCEALINKIDSSIEYIHSDIETATIPDNFDLVCSASTFQWLQKPQATIDKIHHSLNDKGYLAVSSFAPKHFHELSDTLFSLGIKQAAMSYLNSEAWQALLTPNFDILEISESTHTEYFTDLRELFIHLRRTGVNGNRLETLSHSQIRSLEKSYSLNHKTEKGIPLSYKPIQIIARKR